MEISRRYGSHEVTRTELVELVDGIPLLWELEKKMTLALTWRGGTGIGTTTSSWSSHLKVGSSAIAIHPKATRCRIGVYPKLTSEMDMNLCRDRVHLPIFLHRNMRVLDPKATL